jgi:hypothetical protein
VHKAANEENKGIMEKGGGINVTKKYNQGIINKK